MSIHEDGPLTGTPDAGNPPVRCGGRGGCRFGILSYPDPEAPENCRGGANGHIGHPHTLACFRGMVSHGNMANMTEPENKNNAAHIVAIETSSRIGSVAVACGPRVLAVREFSQSMRHAVELMPGIAELTSHQGWKPTDIDQVYVSVGPGSFTGVRIAIAMARAISQGVGARLVAVPTLDVLAANAPQGTVNLVVLLDAKRGQVYAARYTADDGAIVGSNNKVAGQAIGPARLRCTTGPVLCDPAEFVRDSPKPLLLLGEGINYHRAALVAGGLDGHFVCEAASELCQPAARQVHALGWRLASVGQFTPLEKLLPIYIRKPEAQEVWEKKQAACATGRNNT